MMTTEEQLKIIEDHQRALPIEAVNIAEALGLTVHRTTNWDDEGNSGVSGKIVRDRQRGGKSGYAIYVNGAHSLARRRFTIAHEIAHFILHREHIGDGIFGEALYKSDLQSDLEASANRLAARILMPMHLLEKKFNELPSDFSSERIIAILADDFKVSREVMTYRLGDLGLIDKLEMLLVAIERCI